MSWWLHVLRMAASSHQTPAHPSWLLGLSGRILLTSSLQRMEIPWILTLLWQAHLGFQSHLVEMLNLMQKLIQSRLWTQRGTFLVPLQLKLQQVCAFLTCSPVLS